MNIWTCYKCGHDVADTEGSVAVPTQEIAEMPMFGPAWAPIHTLCMDKGWDYYAIPVDELRDAEGVVSWTAHLLGKVWLANSNWDAIIRSTVKGVSV